MTSQSVFVTALLDPEAPRPDGLSDGSGRKAGRRFDVYRNNVVVSLTEALRTAFPVLEKLLGAQNFTILARAFVRQHPPQSPVMMFYGAEMPAFLGTFEPTRATGYLPDIARLELAMRESYHAANSVAVEATSLAALPPDELANARLTLAPSLRLIRSNWPIHAIWHFNTEAGAEKPQMQAEDVIVLRPEFDPVPHLLPDGGGDFMVALLSGATLGDALEASPTDLAAILRLLLQHGAITEVTT